MPNLVRVLSATMVLGACLSAQTTDGLIGGVVSGARTSRPIEGAFVTCSNLQLGTKLRVQTGADGTYACALMPPGSYSVRVEAGSAWHPRELYGVELRVGGSTEVDLRLRARDDILASDLSAPAPAVTFYGPDAGYSRLLTVTPAAVVQRALESTVSVVIEPESLRRLPFAGRDAYTMLVLQPGVAAETSSARGVGVSIFGQRPTSSNFLLDGIENNNLQVTGPLLAIAPEALSEYRVSTGVFTAEYGNTAGFLANAVTVAGQRRWHGIAYAHREDERLNANDFQSNRENLPRAPQRDNQWGFQAGGPLPWRGFFASGSFEYIRNRGKRPPADIKVPDPRYVAPGAAARALLARFPTPATIPGDGRISNITVVPEVTLDRYSGFARLDSRGAGRDRWFARIALTRFFWPDFIWYPYTEFNSELKNPVTSAAAGWVRAASPTVLNELRAGWTDTKLGWDRPHPELPTVSVGTTPSPIDRPGDEFRPTLLPGSPAAYEFHEHARQFEVNDNATIVTGRHIVKFGGTLQLRHSDSLMSLWRDGRYNFAAMLNFGADNLQSLDIALDPLRTPEARVPENERSFRWTRYAAFLQDAFRVTSRLVLNAGLRYENYGAPVNRGMTPDLGIQFGLGPTFEQRIAGAILAPVASAYEADGNNFAPRAGFAWVAPAGIIVRGAYGVFFDRPFDNLLSIRNNSALLVRFTASPQQRPDYTRPASELLSGYSGRPYTENTAIRPVAVDPDLRTPYAQNFFLGAQTSVGTRLSIEVNGLGSLGRKLITTDRINRNFSTPDGPNGRFQPGLPELSYRANQGTSEYRALTALLRYRRRAGLVQAAWTLSRTRDNQSDPLAREQFDLNSINLSRLRPQARRAFASFSRQFDSSVDRGYADFDQRHNLVLYTHWDSAARRAILRDWRVGGIAVFRSGLPFTVFGGAARGIVNQRTDLVNPNAAFLEAPVDGGVRLLPRSSFSSPAGRLGLTERNAFRGPGYYGVDASVSRGFRLPRLPESSRLFLRADVFNVLNHANLSNPRNSLDFADFGVSYYGRSESETGFPTVIPLRESPRRIQLMLRFEF